MTTVIYAVGGGAGHRTRAQRVRDALRLDVRIVTNDDVPAHLEHDLEAHRDWLRNLGTDRILADAFPAGIRGELRELATPIDYVARLLQWHDYVRSAGLPQHIGTTYIVEELTPEHDAWVRAHSDRVIELPLRIDHEEVAAEEFWLLVHSGPAAEVEELIAYANELRGGAHVVVSTFADVALPDGFTRATEPAIALMPRARRIVSAAGFNVMLETEALHDRHIVMPFPRRFDDQFTRAARRRLRYAVAP